MSQKLYTPQQAAMMVLAKAQEMLKLSPLYKGEWNKIHHKLEEEGYSKESADKIDGSIKAKLGKSEEEPSEKNPDEKEDAELGEKVEHEVEAHEAANPEAEAKEHREKGSYKLAKFMGKRELKKSQKEKSMAKEELGDAANAQGQRPNGGSVMDKSQAAPMAKPAAAPMHAQPAQAPMVQTKPAAAPMAPAKSVHEHALDQIHQMSKPKA